MRPTSRPITTPPPGTERQVAPQGAQGGRRLQVLQALEEGRSWRRAFSLLTTGPRHDVAARRRRVPLLREPHALRQDRVRHRSRRARGPGRGQRQRQVDADEDPRRAGEARLRACCRCSAARASPSSRRSPPSPKAPRCAPSSRWPRRRCAAALDEHARAEPRAREHRTTRRRSPSSPRSPSRSNGTAAGTPATRPRSCSIASA